MATVALTAAKNMYDGETTMIFSVRFASTLSCVGGLILATATSQAASRLDVVLVPTSDEYVLGEPVVVAVAVKNVGKDTVHLRQVLVERVNPEVHIFLSEDGVSFEEYVMGIFPDVDAVRGTTAIKPGVCEIYRLRILYAYYPDSHLAFSVPGIYRIKATLPLNINTPDSDERYNHEDLHSNSVQISIKEPEGVDATLWKTLRDPEFLHFIQGGFPPQEDSDVPLRVARLVNSVSDSSYHAALRWALKEYSLHNKLEGEARREIEKALSPQDLLYVLKRFGLDRIPEPPRPFPEDPRLDVTLKLHYPKETNWEQVLEDVSKQSGIRLLIARGVQLPSEGIAALHWTPTLRQVMNTAAYTRGNWIREGNGYRLIPVHLGSGKAPVKTGAE